MLGRGEDFLDYYTAAIQLRHGNLYDATHFGALALRVCGCAAGTYHSLYFPQLPFIPWFAQPLTALPENLAFLLYDLLISAGIALAAWLTFETWPQKARLLTALLIPVTGLALKGAILGTDTWLVVVGLGIMWHARAHDAPLEAGLGLCLTMAKPQIGLPLVVVGLWGWPPMSRKRLAVVLALALPLFFALALPLTTHPGIYGGWIASLQGLQNTGQGDQPNVRGLLQLFLPANLATAGAVAALPCALLLFCWTLGDPRESRAEWQAGWLGALAVALLFTPYSHVTDSLLLVAPLLAVLFPSGDIAQMPARVTRASLCIFIEVPLVFMLVEDISWTKQLYALYPLWALWASRNAPRRSAIGTREPSTHDPVPLATQAAAQ